MNKNILAGMTVLAALSLTGCATTGAAASKPSPTKTAFSIDGYGTVSVPLDYFPGADPAQKAGDDCSGTSGYDDISEGAQVVVSDATGKTVGVGSLLAGMITPSSASDSMYLARCDYRFTVTVKGKSDFYGIAVGNTARGSVKVTADELQSGADLTIGD